MSTSNSRLNLFLIVFDGFVLFSSFYLVSVKPHFLDAIGLNASPIYFWTVVGSFLAFICMILRPEALKINAISLVSAIMIVYLLLTQFIVGAQLNALAHLLTNYIFLFIVSSFGTSIETSMYTKSFEKTVGVLLFINGFLLILDTAWRFRTLGNIYYGVFALMYGELTFYTYKVDSLLFGDSNSVGFLALSLYTFCSLQTNRIKSIILYRFLFALMVIFSLSRSAIIGLAFVMLSKMLSKVIRHWELMLTVISLTTLFLFTFVPQYLRPIYEPILGSEGSFRTKIYIAEKTSKFFLSQDVTTKLIGIGAGNAALNPRFGIGAHNLFSTYVLETGVIGTLLFFVISILILMKFKHLAYRFFTFLYICGMSFVPHGIPYFYVLMFLNYLLNLKCLSEKRGGTI